jgi:DNA polymerase V
LGCGIPVSIGIGSTKTRAKLASARAKPAAGGRGVFDIEELAQRDPFGLEKLLASRPCSDIWGVGPRTAHKLAERGAITALDLALADLPEMKKLGTITLERVAAELRGEPRHALCDNPEPAQSLSRTRTFDHALTTHRELSAALAGFAEVACAQLRATGALAAKAEIFIGTHPMDKRSASRFASAPLELSSPSNDSLLVCSLAAAALRSIYKPGFNYRRAGIAFSGLSADAEFGARSVQTETLGPAELILAEPGAFAPPARVLPIEPPKGSR